MNDSEASKFIKNSKNIKLQQNFIGTFASDEFDDFKKIIDELDDIDNPAALFNTDEKSAPGTHWVAIILLNDNSVFVFDSFGMTGFKGFVIDNDKEIMSSFLDMSKTIKEEDFDNGYIDIRKFSFDVKKYLNSKRRPELSAYCKGLFDFFISITKKKEKKITFYYTADQLQSIQTSFCGVYSLRALFEIYKKALTIENVSSTLNRTFVDPKNTGKNKAININTNIVDEFADDYNIKGDFWFNPTEI